MVEDDNQVMKAALEAGRAVYHADLHYNLGLAIFDTLRESLGEKEGDLDGAIAEFREAVRLDSNNALAQYFLRLALSRKEFPARPEEGKRFPGPETGTPEFEELDKFTLVDPMPVWPRAEQNIRKDYREQEGREPTDQELAEIKHCIREFPSRGDLLLSTALEAGKQAYREAKRAIAGDGPIQQGEHVILENKPTKGDAGKVKKTPEEEIHEIYGFVRNFKWFCIGVCILWVLRWLIAKF